MHKGLKRLKVWHNIRISIENIYISRIDEKREFRQYKG